MNDAEYIKALQRDLAVLATTIEQRDRELAAAKAQIELLVKSHRAAQETIKAAVTRAELAEQRAELMRQIACAITASTNKIQRIANGEKE